MLTDYFHCSSFVLRYRPSHTAATATAINTPSHAQSAPRHVIASKTTASPRKPRDCMAKYTSSLSAYDLENKLPMLAINQPRWLAVETCPTTRLCRARNILLAACSKT